MIIVEGMDNSGKTTLISDLLANLRGKYLVRKSPGPQHDNLGRHKLVRWCFHQLLSPYNDRLILDRWAPISEMVYGRLLRGGSLFDEHPESKQLFRLWEDVPTLVIFCRPPDAYLFNTTKSEMEGVRENALALTQEYDMVIHTVADQINSSMNLTHRSAVWVYDYTVDDPSLLCERIEEWQRYIRQNA